ncbi:MAG: type II toxin-antitoxin system VapC family toxin [Alphaproteobacteria bacterium]|nr:type II toxin-antitoxin system VapC family toxin [Rickettsiales bacterium]NBY35812.1 type II toxin-antitoxin system VapC family toxin [Alphaproteobacteria bacterium]
MKYVLDTNIVSELRKTLPTPNVVKWMEGVPSNQIYLSCIAISDLRSGALKKAKQDKRAGPVLTKLIDELISSYEELIVLIDLEICKKWAELLTIDSLLLAQAFTNNMVLVTNNIKHFKMFGAKYLNPLGEENV